jgi:cell division cycle protein 20 (cofactor of APC complex)
LNKRILSFSVAPPVSSLASNDAAQWNRPLRHATKRAIPTVPTQILDAPGILDDYYLNLLDWSSSNQVAVALNDSCFIWNASTGGVEELFSTGEDDYITSVKWTGDGTYLAGIYIHLYCLVGTGSGDTQIWDAETNQKIRSMNGHVSRVGVLAWDKHVLASGSKDGSIHTHDVRIARHKTGQLDSHTGEVCGLAYREDGAVLARYT